MWFLVLAYGLGVTTTALGTVLMSNKAYNPLTDLWSTPLVLLHLLFLHALRWILTRVARKAKIWRVPPSADQGQEGSGRFEARTGSPPGPEGRVTVNVGRVVVNVGRVAASLRP